MNKSVMKKSRTLLALLLAVSMVLSMSSVTSLAADMPQTEDAEKNGNDTAITDETAETEAVGAEEAAEDENGEAQPAAQADPTAAPETTGAEVAPTSVPVEPTATPVPAATEAEVTPTPAPTEPAAEPTASPEPTEAPEAEITETPTPTGAGEDEENDDTPVSELTCTVDGAEFTAEVSAEAGLPEGTTLRAERIAEDDGEYRTIASVFDAKLGITEDGDACADYILYDLSFMADETEVEPEGNVKITMNFAESLGTTLLADGASFKEAKILHQKDDGTVEIMKDGKVERDAEGKISSASFTGDSFSVYGIAMVYTEGSADEGDADKNLSPADETEGTDGTATGLNIENYVTNITVTYSTDGWKSQKTYDYLSESTATIPADAEIRLDVTYGKTNNIKGIPLNNIIDADYTLTFTLPDFFKDAKAGGSIMSDGEGVGTITVKNGKAVIKLDQDFIAGKQNDVDYTLSGDFYVQGKVDISKVEVPGPNVYTSGPVKISFNFGGDVVAKYGDIKIEKTGATMTVEEENGVDVPYLKYEIKVTAGSDGVMPGVVVKDELTENSYVECYVDINPSITKLEGAKESGKNPAETITDGTAADKGHGSIQATTTDGKKGFTWTIGDMQPDEVRTLTYYVKMNSAYIGGSAKNTLTNTATVYTTLSDDKTEYERASDDGIFTPAAAVTLTKNGSKLEKEKDTNGNSTGNYLITYTVTVKADDKNTYMLKNVILKDVISTNITNLTGGLTNFELVENSVSWYEGENASGNTLADTGNFTLTATSNGTDGSLFNVTIGALQKGKAYTFTYKVRVSASVIAAVGNNDGTTTKNLTNTISLYDKDEKPIGSNGQAITALKARKWTRKLQVNKEIDADTTIDMDGGTSYYDATNDSVQSVTPSDTTFTVKKGATQFKVLVNEEGDWNVNGTTFCDQLLNNGNSSDKSDYVKYSGWLKLTAYDTSKMSDLPSVSTADTNAINKFNGVTPVKTIWIKVDGLKTFSFKPEDIGITDANNYAYILEYYVHTDQADEVSFTNQFEITDNVGIGDNKYEIAGTEIQTNSVTSGTESLDANKTAWYYDDDTVQNGNSTTNGQLYWIIEVNADNMNDNTLPKGLKIMDVPSGGAAWNADGNSINDRGNANVQGVWLFTGDEGKTASITAESSLANFIENSDSGFTELDNRWLGNAGTVAVANNNFLWTVSNGTYGRQGVLEVTAENGYKLAEGKSLYLIVSSEPANSLPKGGRAAEKFTNTLYTNLSTGENTKLDRGTAEKYVYDNGDILKETGAVYTWDGTSAKIISGSHEQNTRVLVTDGLASGTYVTWDIKINYDGEMSGTYFLEDTAPEGLEPVYARIKWRGTEQRSGSLASYSGNMGDGWIRKEITYGLDGESNVTSYYYTNTNYPHTIRWGITGLTGVPNVFDDYAVDFQVVFKVTDTDVLRGAEKSFDNTVKLYSTSQFSDALAESSSTWKVQRTNLSKDYVIQTNDDDSYKNQITYTLTVNELNENLTTEESIVLKDIVSGPLSVDPDSIVVKNKSGSKLDSSQYTVGQSEDGKTLTITLPDNKYLTVEYVATVQAASGETVTGISNKAYWEGYNASVIELETNSFSYQAGGTVTLAEHPSIKIIKSSSKNSNTKLEGVTFKLKEVGKFSLNSDGKTVYTESTTPSQKETTDSNGTLEFKNLEYDTLYELTETKTKAGYVLGKTPRYVILKKSENNLDYNSMTVKEKINNADIEFLEDQGTVELKISNDPVTYTPILTKERKLKDESSNLEIPKENYEFTLSFVKATSGDQSGQRLPDKTKVTVDSTDFDTNNTCAVKFDPITFTAAGTYVYKITETAGDTPAMAYAAPVTFTVTVTEDSETGELTAKESTTESERLVMTNIYQNPEGEAVLQVTKGVSGNTVEYNKISPAPEYTFTLAKAERTTGEPNTDVLPASENAVAESTNGYVATFDAIKYTEAGTYYYTIKEQEPENNEKIPGMTYNTATYYAKVVVEYNDNTQKYDKTTITYGTSKEACDSNALTITNKYSKVSWTPVGTKVLSGRSLKADDKFTFQVKDKDGNEVSTGTCTGPDGNIVFEPVTYYGLESAKTYTYTISEVEGSAGGITYDKNKYKVTVEVDANGNGELTWTATYPGNADKVTFTNTYTATGTWTPVGEKELTGRDYENGEIFTYQVYDEDQKKVVSTGKNTANGEITFTPIEYKLTNIPAEGKTYRYSVSEVEGSEEGLNYDNTVFTFTLKVEDDGEGGLKFTPNYGSTKISFTNSYNAVGIWTPEGTKTFTGRDYEPEETFTYEVKEGDTVVTTGSNTSNGSIAFGRVNYTVEDVGTHSYTISEVNGGKAGVTYDTKVYHVEVKVSDNGDGTLKVEPTYTDGAVTFTNTYEAAGSWTPEGTKELTGRGYETGETFTYEVKEGDTVVATGSNSADGPITFTAVNYTMEDVGVHTYTISEVAGSTGGLTYDSTVFTVSVTVADKGDGTLEVMADYGGRAVSFTNSYGAGGSWTPEGTKTFTGREYLNGDSFSYEVKEGDTVVATGSNVKNGSITFETVNYTLNDVGTHEYTISEVNEERIGITYDTTVFHVTVKVSDVGDGTLKVEPTYTDGAVSFTNTYEEKEEETSLSVTKTLTSNGSTLGAVDATFYVALYSDADCTKRVSDIKTLHYENASSSTATFTGLEPGKTYYVGECDADGVRFTSAALADGTLYGAIFSDGNTVVIEEEGGTKTIYFNNEFQKIPTQYYNEGTLTITKKVFGADGEEKNVEEIFYAGIFADPEYTTLSDVVSQNIVALDMDGGCEAGTEIKVALTEGAVTTLYVTEVDEDGTPVEGTSGFTYKVSVDETSVELSTTNNSDSVTITNTEKPDATATPTPEVTQTPTPTPAATSSTITTAASSSGGSSSSSTTAAKTGDDTPIALYILLLAAAGAGIIFICRKSKRNR